MNILTIDIGNTNIFICLFDKEKPIQFVKIRNTKLTKTMLKKHLLIKNRKNSFFNIVISSVVPSISEVIIDFLKTYKIKFYLVKNLIKTLDIKINIKNKKKIGEDRIVNAYYAKKKYSKNLIVIDFGTATTFDVIDSKGNYDGGIITPGIDLSLKVLSEKTAKLPLVKFAKTKNVIGRDTKSAIQSGFFWGYVSMIQGLVKNISREKKNSFRVILTGGNCDIFNSFIENVIVSDDLFNSKGLNFIINEYLKNEY